MIFEFINLLLICLLLFLILNRPVFPITATGVCKIFQTHLLNLQMSVIFRVYQAAKTAGLPLITPMHGQTFSPSEQPYLHTLWWLNPEETKQ